MRQLILIFILYTPYVVSAENVSLTTIGWIESVRLLPEKFELQAKIDTGADHSSLGVVDWQSFERNGDEWIRYNVTNNDGHAQVFERPLERYALIKRKATESLKRPVVKMWVCLGKKKILTQVNLAKRTKFKYRMLIGRSFLKGEFLVDSAAKHTQSTECTAAQ